MLLCMSKRPCRARFRKTYSTTQWKLAVLGVFKIASMTESVARDAWRVMPACPQLETFR